MRRRTGCLIQHPGQFPGRRSILEHTFDFST
jgi:hypothetical protein